MFHDVIDQAAYMPHGYCLLWEPWLITLHVASDTLIFLAYAAIPLAIWIFLKRRAELHLRGLAVLFCVFIFLCGLSHLMQAITLWIPIYQIQGAIKAATALVSLATAILIFPLIPQALAIPSPAELQRANARLEGEAASHRRTMEELERAKKDLEDRVAERTSELEKAKARFETLVQASAEVVWTAHPSGESSADSPSWRTFTGQSLAEFEGWGWLDAIHPNDRDDAVAAWRDAVTSRTMYKAEYRLQHAASGSWRWVTARATPLPCDGKSAPEWIGMNTDITERKNAEMSIHLQADQYAAILAASTDGFMLLDHHARLLDVNDSYCRMSGYSREELLNMRFSDLEAFRTETELDEKIEQIIFDGYDHFETQHRKKNGQTFFIECSAAYWGATGQVICFSRDITQRKNAEQALRESEEGLREAQQIAGLGSWELDLVANTLRWSEGLYRIMGLKTAQPAPSFAEFIEYALADDRKALEDSIAELRESGKPSRLEYRIVRADGELRHVEARGRRYGDAQGAPIRLAGTIHDITERKKIEERLKASALYIRSLFEASLDLLITVDTEGRILDVNRASERMFSAPRQDIIGTDFAGHFDQPQAVRAGLADVLANGFASDLPLSISQRPGETVELLCNAAVFRNPDGAVAGVFAAGRDVTQLKRVQDELREHQEHLEDLVDSRTQELASANEKLKHANSEMESFSYSVSHDLRVPLRAIDGFSRALLEDYGDKLDEDGARLLNVVHDNTARMGRLIDDILSFSRVGRAEMSEGDIDMDTVVQAVLTDLQAVVRKRVVHFDVSPLPRAWGDPAMMQRVWTNLIENAVKYSGKKPEAKIEIGASSCDGETIYHVKDNGAGFDMQYASKLFGVFQRLHSSEFNGTGIGLAIVKRIVTRHGGRVWAEGKPDEGATFFFALPATGVPQGNQA